jgi:hypothetical protein
VVRCGAVEQEMLRHGASSIISTSDHKQSVVATGRSPAAPPAPACCAPAALASTSQIKTLDAWL